MTFELSILIIAAILLTTTTAPTGAQIKTEGNGTAIAPGNMTAGGGGENASITNESGSISSSHPYCPLSLVFVSLQSGIL